MNKATLIDRDDVPTYVICQLSLNTMTNIGIESMKTTACKMSQDSVCPKCNDQTPTT